MARDRGSNLPEQGQHRGGSPSAIESNDGGAGGLQAPAGISGGPALSRGAVAGDGERDNGRPAGAPDRLERQQGLAPEGVGLGHDEIDAGLDCPPDLLVEDAARLLLRLGVAGIVDGGIADIAGQQRPGAASHLLGDAERRAVDRGEVSLPADHLELGAMGIVGECLDHV